MKTKSVNECLNNSEYCEKTLQKLVSLTYPEMENLVDDRDSITRNLVNPQIKVEDLEPDAVRQMKRLAEYASKFDH